MQLAISKHKLTEQTAKYITNQTSLLSTSHISLNSYQNTSVAAIDLMGRRNYLPSGNTVGLAPHLKLF